MKRLWITCALAALCLDWVNAVVAMPPATEQLLDEYRALGADNFSAQRGSVLWQQTYVVKGQQRSCTSCHGHDVRTAGKHIKTGKPIKPMASSVNSERFTDAGKIEKWFRRNCLWTMGRECSAQEKGDVVEFLIQGTAR